MTVATSTASTATLVDDWQAVFSTAKSAPGFLKKHNIERDDEIKLMGYAIIAGVDGLLLGEPGVGKTWLIELLLRCLRKAGDVGLFDILLMKEMSADDVLGPRSLPALKNGRIERIMQGFLPTAHVAYLDEYFKAAPPLVNSLLDIQANRQFKVGGVTHSVAQLVLMLMSSNELPDREDLQAIRDRIGWTKYVQPIRTSEGRKAIMDIQLGFQASGIDETQVPSLSLDSIHAMRAEANNVTVPDTIKEVADRAQIQWAEKGFAPSQRRMGQMWRMAKAAAWANGAQQMSTDHLMVWADCAWNHPDHAAPAREVILEFASAFTRKAQRMKETLEPILRELDEVRVRIEQASGEPADEDLEKAYTTMRDLRRMKREVSEQVQAGEDEGHDVSELQSVGDEIERARLWIDQTLKD